MVRQESIFDVPLSEGAPTSTPKDVPKCKMRERVETNNKSMSLKLYFSRPKCYIIQICPYVGRKREGSSGHELRVNVRTVWDSSDERGLS